MQSATETQKIQHVKDLKQIILPNKELCSLSKQELLILVNIAIDKINEINENINNIIEQFANNDDGGNHYDTSMADEANRAYNNPIRITQMNNYNKILEKLRIFVNNLMSNKYSNICDSCGEFIPFGRLKAVPHSNQCVSCKTTMGKNQNYN